MTDNCLIVRTELVPGRPAKFVEANIYIFGNFGKKQQKKDIVAKKALATRYKRDGSKSVSDAVFNSCKSCNRFNSYIRTALKLNFLREYLDQY